MNPTDYGGQHWSYTSKIYMQREKGRERERKRAERVRREREGERREEREAPDSY